jgi:hypothetical protein
VIEDVTIGQAPKPLARRLLTVLLPLPLRSGGQWRAWQLIQGLRSFRSAGTNAVIPGFELGTASMLVSGIRRTHHRSPTLAYGATGNNAPAS